MAKQSNKTTTTKKASKATDKIDASKTSKIVEQTVTDCLITNYMPYAMSVIISRSILEIDGFKPSHRKILYNMYQKGLLNSKFTKSANVVGSTMKYNPHGDSSIYDAMVRMTDSNETLLFPLIMGKGSFGKCYSRDMPPAAPRYTEVKLMPQSETLFRDMDKNAVDMMDNYDGTAKEPTLLPVVFPIILANCNQGIAVSMASNICSFNLIELCETTIALLKNSKANLHKTLLAPDFPSGGELLYDNKALDEVYKTGRGSFKLRSVWTYDKAANCIDITEIPYTTTVEVIIEKIVDLVKTGRVKEISDIRDETDLRGLKITIDLKSNSDPEKVMQKLFKLTTLQDSFSANFNILIDGNPKVLGVREILNHWIAFRINCKRRALTYDLAKKESKLHLMDGLLSIILDIDKVVKTIRSVQDDADVVPVLMKKFKLDNLQASYIADIRLRNLNKNYIINATQNYDALKSEIESLRLDIDDDKRLKNIIIKELRDVSKKYGQLRKTKIITDVVSEYVEEEPQAFKATFLLTKESYVKRLPEGIDISLEQKLKEDDEIIEFNPCASSEEEVLVFTDKYNVYKKRIGELPEGKANILGDYLPSLVGMPIEENSIFCCSLEEDKYLVLCFENGKVAKIPMSVYKTLTNRKKLVNAYYSGSKLIGIVKAKSNDSISIELDNGKNKIVSISKINEKTTKNTQGIQVVTNKKIKPINISVVKR